MCAEKECRLGKFSDSPAVIQHVAGLVLTLRDQSAMYVPCQHIEREAVLLGVWLSITKSVRHL